MHITSVTRLRLDTTHGTTDWNKQNRRMHDNSWLMTLPFDVDNTGCHVPPFQRSDISSKHLKYYQDDYLVFDHYTSFTEMLSLSYLCHWQAFPNMFLIPWHLRIFQNIHHHQHGDCRILANGMQNMAFGMLLLPHFSFGQKTSTRSP